MEKIFVESHARSDKISVDTNSILILLGERSENVMEDQIIISHPAKNIFRNNVVLMLVQRLRRWPNITTTLGHDLHEKGRYR